MRLDITVTGTQVVSRRINKVAERVSDMRPAFDEAYERFRELQQIQFAAQGRGPDGPWKPLHPKTVAIKAKLGLDPRVLHRTFRLRNSLTKLRGTGGRYRRNKDGIFMGTTVAYAGYHQTGTERMPRRPPVDLDKQDERELIQTIQDWIVA